MHRASSVWPAVALLFIAACAVAQNVQKEQGKEPDKSESPKPRPTLDKVKIPPGAVFVLVEQLKDATSLIPQAIILSLEKWQEQQERIAVLEKMLKPEKRPAQVCKLSGRVEGDFVHLRAEFAFTTEQPRTQVVLGMQGAHLTEEGDLDRQLPNLDVGEEGYVVRVDGEGTHRLALHLKAPLSVKRTGAAGGSERGFELGLPGAAVTTLALEMPAGVQEIRWNDNLEKRRGNNRWDLALGKIKSLQLWWKEPPSAAGGGPLLTADAQVLVKWEETQVTLSAELFLEDLRGQTKQWELQLPANAQVEVKSSGSLDLTAPDGKTPHYRLRLAEPSTERIHLHIFARHPQPLAGPRFLVGPFFVTNAYRQQGTIQIQASAAALGGQRLIFHRFGEVYQQDVPKAAGANETIALFKYWMSNLGKAGKPPPRVPLELEWKANKVPVETTLDHVVRLRRAAQGWLVETNSRLHAKTLQTGVDFVDLQLPKQKIASWDFPGGQALLPFPAALPWWDLVPSAKRPPFAAWPLGFQVEDDATGPEISEPDGQRRTRIRWSRPTGKDLAASIVGKYWLPEDTQRVRLDLPRPLGILDRGGKITIVVDEQMELLVGPADDQTPAVERNKTQFAVDQAPDHLDLVWRPYRQGLPVTSLTDVQFFDEFAQARTHLHLDSVPRSPGSAAGQSSQVRLRVPAGTRRLQLISGGKFLGHDEDKGMAWVVPIVEPGGKVELFFEYEFALANQEAAEDAAPVFAVPLLWPAGATSQEAKVRFWTDGGVLPELAAPAGWQKRGIELVPAVAAVPALVVGGSDAAAPLTVRLRKSGPSHAAAMLCDRSLVQAAIDEENNQIYRVRFFVRRFQARHVDLEFSIPASECLQNVLVDQKKAAWFSPEPAWNVARIPIEPSLFSQPVVLEIDYKIPAAFAKSKIHQLTLQPPRIRGEALVGKVRWQVQMPGHWVAFVSEGGMDYRWGWEGWLLGPEASVTAADLESWLLGRDSGEAPAAVSLAFWRTGLSPVAVWRLPRPVWLLICSGAVLVLGMGLYFVSWSRTLFWMLTLILVAALGSAALWWPGAIPAFLMGAQPGALVLLLLCGMQWLLHRSYRRQVVFLPAFTRHEAPSSVRDSNRPRDVSTVDQPLASPGSGSSMATPGSRI
ncbi:MAG: hypothetical protein L0Y72_03040 [Gemmataceae bacterium]|nr:hypothetical protein [Gemmataceae bacterium]MCI0737993.1 hypothetical protein [Gemmataceae bacterium]